MIKGVPHQNPGKTKRDMIMMTKRLILFECALLHAAGTDGIAANFERKKEIGGLDEGQTSR